MAERLGRDALLVELGSGSSLKIRVLLEACGPRSTCRWTSRRTICCKSAEALAATFPVAAGARRLCRLLGALQLPVDDHEHPRAAFFPGSSVGNFEPAGAERFLRRVGDLLDSGGRLLVGVDLVKDHRVLEAAYNDADGVTADFNLNLLTRINRELDADFDLTGFRHSAWFNPELSRIEMHLVSTREQQVSVAGRSFAFREGESIHTECSYKYSIEGFHHLARRAGFEPEQVWTDADGRRRSGPAVQRALPGLARMTPAQRDRSRHSPKLVGENARRSDVDQPWEQDNQAWWDWYLTLADNGDDPVGPLRDADPLPAVANHRRGCHRRGVAHLVFRVPGRAGVLSQQRVHQAARRALAGGDPAACGKNSSNCSAPPSTPSSTAAPWSAFSVWSWRGCTIGCCATTC
jgi:dimethylhistidine N-methyltransferase